MGTLLIITPDLMTGLARISPTIETGFNPDDGTPTDAPNPAVRPFEFTTDGVSCRAVLEENSTIFNAPRKDDDTYHEPIGEGVNRLTLNGSLPLTPALTPEFRYTRPFYPIHVWRKNQNKVQITSPLAQFDIPAQGWTIDRFTHNLELSPYVLNWRIVLSGGIREITPRG